MSHFSVIVIGPEVEKQLAPFHEYECTDTNDEYVQDVDVTADVLAALGENYTAEDLSEALSDCGLEDRIVSDESEVDTGAAKGDSKAPHAWGYAIVKDGKLVKAIDRTNPNKQWDWWVVGGRWSGFLKLKAGTQGELGRKGLMGSCANDGPGRADQCKLGDIDIDGMRDDAGNKAAAKFDMAHAALLEAGAPAEWSSWKKCRSEQAGIEAAREAYHAQPSVKAITAAFKGHFFLEPDQFLVARDEYIKAARDSAIAPFAVVKDGQWYERGSMGWWGMVSDEKDAKVWNAKVGELLDGLPPDTLITVVDCHI